MHDFKVFKEAVGEQFSSMKGNLYVTDVTKEELWETYLESYPPQENKVFRERREFDCQACKRFVVTSGAVVAITNDYELQSIWDVDVPEPFKTVAEAMANLVKSRGIRERFIHKESVVGLDYNVQVLEGGETIKWNHFFHKLRNNQWSTQADKFVAVSRDNYSVFKRSLDEITLEASSTVIELIKEGNLYRGDEMLDQVESFYEHQIEYELHPYNKEEYCRYYADTARAARIRNSSIGTLLVDLSEGAPLERAVASFEQKVAPTNYRRTSAVVTKKMVQNAQAKVEELGLNELLNRRYAVEGDISVNNILFVDRDVKPAMNVFEEMIKEAPSKKIPRGDEISIDTFVKDVLPSTHGVELLFENGHVNNLVSLVAPGEDSNKRLFKWDNNFSWSYKGEVADSIKEKVSKAGGRTDAVLRLSLAWSNYDDLDLHVITPAGRHIYFGNKGRSYEAGKLDVDMNVSPETRTPVENIVWTTKKGLDSGEYQVFVHNYTPRETKDVGFEVEMEYEGKVWNFYYPQKVVDKVNVVKFMLSRTVGLKILESLNTKAASKDVWNLKTQTFHKVKTVMQSPNYWNGKGVGNKHWFFMLDGCRNPEAARGFYNEFLRNDLVEHRKVFEILGSKVNTGQSGDQLSGLGFSSTQRREIKCKVTGDFGSRVYNLKF